MKGPIAKGTIRTTFVLGLRLVVQTGTLLLVARMLGPREFGAFAGVAALAVMLGTMSSFGTHIVLLGEVSKNSRRRDEVLSYAIPTTLLCGGILLGIYLLACTLVVRNTDVALPVVLAIGIAEMWLQPLIGLLAAERHGVGHIARAQLLQILPLILRFATATAVFILISTNRFAFYAYGYLAASLLALAYAMRVAQFPWPAPSRWKLPSTTQLRETAGYAVLNITAAAPAELDKTLATSLLPLAGAGVYAAGARVAGAATLPINALMLSALPRLFREGQQNTSRTGYLSRRIFCTALAYGSIAAVTLWLVAPWCEPVFGAKYHSIDHTIRLLCLAIPGMALRRVAGNILMATGKPWMRVGFELSGLAIMTTAAIVLTAVRGTDGMALAFVCGEWSMAALGLILTMLPRTNEVSRDRRDFDETS